MKSIIASFGFVTITAIGCAHDPLGPGGGNNVGTGTSTILVTGSARATSPTVNASFDTDFTTQFDFDLSINNATLTTGTVTLTGKTQVTNLTFQPNGGQGQGTWTGTSANYDPVYELNVTSGTDNIKGVYVQGPDIHLFTTPTAGATLDGTMTIMTTWKRANEAQEARFGVGDLGGGNGGGIVIPDSETYAIAAGTLHMNRGQSTPNTMHLTRSNNIVPKGAVAGSMVTVSITQSLDVVALPCTTCP